MIEKINELLEDFKGMQTSFQNENFVIRKQRNLYGQYLQSLRELSGRLDSLRSETFQLERHMIDIEELEYKLNNAVGFDLKRLEIDLREKQFSVAPMQRRLKELEEDVSQFYGAAIYLKEQLPKDKTKEELELEMWSERVSENIAIDFLIDGRMSKSNYEFLKSLPNSEIKKITKEIESEDFVKKFEEREILEIPKFEKKEIKNICD